MVERRLRTDWVLRRRWARAASVATVLGAAVGVTLAALLVRAVLAAGHSVDRDVVLAILTILALTSLLPRWIVSRLGRRVRRRHREG